MMKPISVIFILVLFIGLFEVLMRSSEQKLLKNVENLEITNLSILKNKLEAIQTSPRPRIVFLGDSLIVGKTLFQHGDQNWQQHRISELVRQMLSRDPASTWNDASIFTLGLDGALPQDLFRMTEVLLSSASVDLVIFDFGIRSFSKDFWAQNQVFSREWLKNIQIDQGQIKVKPPRRGDYVNSQISEFIEDYSKSLRLRNSIQQLLSDAIPILNVKTLMGLKQKTEDEDPVLHLLKSKRRYDGVDLNPENPQLQGFDQLLRLLEEKKQNTIVFQAKENPKIVHSLMTPERYHKLSTELSDLVSRRASGGFIQFLPPIDELTSEFYLDQIHVNFQGNQIYAMKLMDLIIKQENKFSN